MPDLDPIIINVPGVPGPKLPLIDRVRSYLRANSARSTKIITSVSAIVMGASMVGFVAFTAITNNSSFKKQHHISTGGQIVPDQESGVKKSASALPGGDTVVGTSVQTGTNSPVVTLSATPSSVTVGGKSHLKWSVTNNPKECTASDDWSGKKDPSGEADTQALTVVQTYIFTLTCKTDTGTGFSTVSIGAVEQGGTGNVATRPKVTLAATPTSVYAGLTSYLSWSVSNAPTSCTASGDWSGAKSASGTGAEETAALSTVKTYSYTLTCSNSAGSGYATVTVAAVAPPPDIPIVGLTSTTQSPALAGVKPKLDWVTVNSPTSCTASGDWSGAKSTAGGSETLPTLSVVGRVYSYTLTCSNSSGSISDTISFTIVPSPPQVSLSVTSNWQYVGGTATVTWSATNSPTSCVSSGDWSGALTGTSGTKSINLTTAKTYLFSLDCQNAGGHGYQNNVPLVVPNPPVPVVTINVSPISITTGSSASVTWSATNNPTSCTPSGNASWASPGTRPSSGTFSTGTLATAGTYSYSLVCANAGGTSTTATATLTVSSGGGGAVKPVVTLSLSPTTIGTGSQTTISWSATNTPTSCTGSNTAGASFSGSSYSASGTTTSGVINTAGTYTFSMTCSNAAGASTPATATLTVVAVPTATISVSPNPITAGSSTTVTWSSSPAATSCSSSGTGWAAASNKAASGNQSVTLSTAGTYTFSIQCTNAGGSGNLASTSVTVNAAAVQYCVVSGTARTPCYGPTTMNQHNTIGNCWAYNQSTSNAADKRVFDVRAFNSNYHSTGKPKTNLLPTNGSTVSALCGNINLASILNGNTGAGTLGTHGHQNATLQNNDTNMLAQALGYYDPSSPN